MIVYFALDHVLKYGDTDIFPRVKEYEIISTYFNQPHILDSKQSLKDFLATQNIVTWKVSTPRTSLVPKHDYGFRKCYQLDPLDTIVFTALVYEMAEEIEKIRVTKGSLL